MIDQNILLWVLGGGFSGTWMILFFFIHRTEDITKEIRREISELKNCIKDHHARISILEDRKEGKK